MKARASSGPKSVFKLLEIECSANATKNFRDASGYLYTECDNGGTNSYFRCKNNKLYNCRGRAIAKNGNLDNVILSVEHSHLPERKILDSTQFRKSLHMACEQNVSAIATSKDFYQQTKVKLKEKVDEMNIGESRRFSTFLHRCQKKHIPTFPKTISQFESSIEDNQYKDTYQFAERNHLRFYRGVWSDGLSSNIVFISQVVLDFINKQGKIILLMDGTFKVLPHHLKFRQLYIISIVFKGQSYPLGFIFTERKNFITYDLIFKKLKLLIPKVNVTNVMSDYEAATRKALKKHFPNARISGCWFHYVQAIMKASKRFGLQKVENLKAEVQKICALALLPNDFVSPGFRIIDQQVQQSKVWIRFKKYWLRQWAPANISVYGLTDRTNNFAETLNHTINLMLKGRHRNIWVLIKNLKLIEMEKSDELKRHDGGYMPTKRLPNEEMTRLNKKISMATEDFQKYEDVEMFLKNITFNDQVELFFKERIYIEGVDKCDDYEDEEDVNLVIPNDYNEESNFRQAHPREAATSSKRKISINSSEKRKK